MMHRSNPISLLLAAAQLGAAARQGFSIHHDLLAFPQFEVVFSDAYISEAEAKSIIDLSYTSKTTTTSSHDKEIQTAVPADPIDDGAEKNHAETYEVMNLPPHKYLCAIPVVESPPSQNQTASELAKAEEARELERASTHGWELVNGLDGTCLYYVSGWWSYSFCYGHDVVQFHALPSKGGPPVKDPTSLEYVLGKVQDPSSTSNSRRSRNGNGKSAEPEGSAPTTELQVKGDQRFLVQRMDDGTVCDLTNRPRTIEIQYHCNPGSTQDRIGWIKEVTTCSYLMVVNTPRLCSDVAFLPPTPTRANIISCRTIVPEADQAAWHEQKTLEAKAAMVGEQRKEAKNPVTIGGVVIGGKKIMGTKEDGKQPPELKPPRHFGKEGPIIEIIAIGNAKDKDEEIHILTAADLERLDISPELVEQLKQEIEELAGDKEWKLEIVEEPGSDMREIRGVVDMDEDELDEEGEGEGAGEAKEGSEEKFFKEEL
ncbi:glucosidase II beta subunit-like protein-domain-containing protein [Xylariales sp. PMI_506]|nr:glucosidase II beta subunit-like protein-domain-containing protein [Xylariales sp. PMI_506]